MEGNPHPVRIVTDHMPLTYLPTKGTLGPRQVRWSEYLSRFHLEWVHTAGKHNIADVLSRMPSHAALVMTRGKTQSQSQSQVQVPVTPMPTSAADSRPVLGQTSHEPRVRPSEQLEAHASEQPEAQASDEGPEQEIFLDEVKAAMQMIHFLLSQAAAGNSPRVPACGGTRIAHCMCQRVELSESSALAMYMITPTQGM